MSEPEMFMRLLAMTGTFWGALAGMRFAITEIRRAVEYV